MPVERADERAAPRPLRLDPRALVAGAAALVVLAGLASSGSLWRHAGGSPLVHLGSGRTIAVAALLGAIVFVAGYSLLTAARPSRGGWISLALLVAVVAALLYVLTLLPRGRQTVRYAHGGTATVTQTATTTASARERPFHLARLGAWWWWAAGAGAVALAVVAWELRRRQAALAVEPESDAAGEMRAAVEVSLEEIERESDPRRAVIKAYVRMESALAASGLPRLRVETPLEYMARTLAALRVTRPPVERLTALFNEAKYSRHPVGTSMKADAIAALRAIRDDLGVSA